MASTENRKPHAFISYRRQDSAIVDELVAALHDTRPTWRDTAKIRGGQPWREAIVQGIDHAYALILVVSSATERSKEVYAEYFYALGCNIPVIPLLVEECELPFGLSRVNARFWYRQQEQALRDLIADLDSYRAEPAVVTPTSAIDTYLNSLQLAYLLNVGNYTPMLGEVRRHRRPEVSHQPLRSVEMHSRFSLRRSSPLRAPELTVEEIRDHQDLLLALHELHQVVLLGEPGIGKTTTLYKYADELRRRCLENSNAPLPVILPLREWKDQTDLTTFVKQHLGALADQYQALLDQKRLCLLCDGLNEIARDKYRVAKVHALRTELNPQVPLVVTCRDLDFRDEVLRLDLDTITMHPLEPSRILDFLSRYLVDAQGEETGPEQAKTLFWQIAGGEKIRTLWHKWRDSGAPLDLFFQAKEIPRRSPNVWDNTSLGDHTRWYERVKTTANLIHLAANPYMLWMFLNVYLEFGHIPSNRGALFDEFVFQLLKREKLTKNEAPNVIGGQLLQQLEQLAWYMQRQATQQGGLDHGVELTLPRAQAVSILGSRKYVGETNLHSAASANILEDAGLVRFTHQLLQEYFSAQRLLVEINKGLSPKELWPPKLWWQSSGWEETIVLAAGKNEDAALKVLQWVLSSNPSVAAACIQRSGITFDDETKIALRSAWLPQTQDLEMHPEPAARAAIGRALGSVFLSSGESLDNRPGVGLRNDGIPDIDWVVINGGVVMLVDDAGEETVGDFHIARYPITNIQFQAFIDDHGFDNQRWWQDLEKQELESPCWSEANVPRDTISWYQAVAFCRWLSDKLGYLVRLPTEFEWQQAATGGDKQRVYPWGKEWDASRCNSADKGLQRTSTVGLYPHGTWQCGPLDMAGNVMEWCLSIYNRPTHNQIDKSNDYRVLRGGPWCGMPDLCQTTYRVGGLPDWSETTLGFRVLRPPSGEH